METQLPEKYRGRSTKCQGSLRILITGPESTGKTTISKQLSTRLHLPLVPEYARTYLEEQGPNYNLDTILIIARGHKKRMLANQSGSCISDTYMINLAVWTQDKFGVVPPLIEECISDMFFDHIFLMYPDTPWTQDGLREDPNRRIALFDEFKSMLEKYNRPYRVIRGLGEHRLENILEHLA